MNSIFKRNEIKIMNTFEEENESMYEEEKLQCKVDRFWGLDLASQSQQLELSNMTREDIFGHLIRKQTKLYDLYETWDLELEKKRDAETDFEQTQSAIISKRYLRSLLQSKHTKSATNFLFSSNNSPIFQGSQLEAMSEVFPSSIQSFTTKSKIMKTLNIDKSIKAIRIKDFQYTSNRVYVLPKGDSNEEYLEMFDGHPVFKWDQIAILKHCFSQLCSDSNNTISFDEFATSLVYDHISSLLAFTVFGSSLKRKNFKAFESLKAMNYFTCEDIINTAEQFTNEVNISIRRIRSLEEHHSICLSNKYRISKRKVLPVIIFKLNDLVFCQHGKGVKWFPAIVQHVHDDGSYDLKYPLTVASSSLYYHKTSSLSTNNFLYHAIHDYTDTNYYELDALLQSYHHFYINMNFITLSSLKDFSYEIIIKNPNLFFVELRDDIYYIQKKYFHILFSVIIELPEINISN